jgi:hypothetical protein
VDTINRMYLEIMGKIKKINPLRFVYYVGHPYLREEIKRKGIQIEKNQFDSSKKPKGIYVYNEKRQPDYSWYPFFFFDFYDYELAESYDNDALRMYDYWQIDTSKIKNNWFKDNWFRRDFDVFKGDDRNYNYIYTDTDIPASAIKLFRFQQEKFYFSKGEKGSVHMRNIGEFRPFNENESFL